MKRYDLRKTAQALIIMRQAEMLRIHSRADSCLPCAVQALLCAERGVNHLPRGFRSPSDTEEFLHARVEMPAARMFARQLDAHGH